MWTSRSSINKCSTHYTLNFYHYEWERQIPFLLEALLGFHNHDPMFFTGAIKTQYFLAWNFLPLICTGNFDTLQTYGHPHNIYTL